MSLNLIFPLPAQNGRRYSTPSSVNTAPSSTKSLIPKNRSKNLNSIKTTAERTDRPTRNSSRISIFSFLIPAKWLAHGGEQILPESWALLFNSSIFGRVPRLSLRRVSAVEVRRRANGKFFGLWLVYLNLAGPALK